ncbi:transcriptional regulator [Sporolactobacillus sp. THM7-4]|nr:transcriptional regulator [Sporolactobacillus sp. THM7-4]
MTEFIVRRCLLFDAYFLASIAPTIVSNMTKMIDYPISITDEKGYIIGATDSHRVKTLHKPSLEVIDRNDAVSFNEEQVTLLENVLPGVAAPILFQKRPIGVLGIIGKPEEVSPFVKPVKNYIELFCTETFHHDMNILENQSVNTLVKYLINPDPSGHFEQAMHMADLLGFDLSTNRACILFQLDHTPNLFHSHRSDTRTDSTPNVLYSQYDRLKYFCIDHHQDILSILNPRQFIVLKTISEKETMPALLQRYKEKTSGLVEYFQSKYRLTITVSVGSTQNARHLAISYNDAVNALNVTKHTNTESHFLYYNDLDINIQSLILNLTPSEKKRLHLAIHRFYDDSHYEVLAQTFMTYCQCNMNLSETSRKLFLHRNSLVYRLNKIARLTSLDISNFEHCFYLYFAIKNFPVQKHSAASDSGCQKIQKQGQKKDQAVT